MIEFLIFWYFFSKYYILGSFFATHILNLSFRKLWLSPLIVNAVSLFVLFLGVQTKFIQTATLGDAIYRIYVPVVFFSFLMNLSIFLYRKCKVFLGYADTEEKDSATVLWLKERMDFVAQHIFKRDK